MFYRFSKNVWRWREIVLCVLRDIGVADKYGVVTIMALIHVESAGDPYARRANKVYNGLTQCYQGYVDEACKEANIPSFPATDLHGDGYLAIWTMIQVFERYARHHEYAAARLAILHKGGPGTLVRLVSLENHGHSTKSAAENISKTWRYPLDYRKVEKRGKLKLPRLGKYLYRWTKFFEIYSKYELKHQKQVSTPSKPLVGWFDKSRWEMPWLS